MMCPVSMPMDTRRRCHRCGCRVAREWRPSPCYPCHRSPDCRDPESHSALYPADLVYLRPQSSLWKMGMEIMSLYVAFSPHGPIQTFPLGNNLLLEERKHGLNLSSQEQDSEH